MPDLDLEELRRAAQSASPGPWCWQVTHERGQDYETGEWIGYVDWSLYVGDAADDEWVLCGQDDRGEYDVEANVRFIAAANPSTVLALLDLVDRLRAEVEVRKDETAHLGAEIQRRDQADERRAAWRAENARRLDG